MAKNSGREIHLGTPKGRYQPLLGLASFHRFWSVTYFCTFSYISLVDSISSGWIDALTGFNIAYLLRPVHEGSSSGLLH